MNDEVSRTAVAVPVQGSVRPLVAAYEDFCGVERGRFDGCTLAEMEDGAAFAGFGDYVAGWCAAIDAAVKEAERLTFALDHGGNQYLRPAGADVVAAVLRKLRPNAQAQPPKVGCSD